jgi:hypothetical protein
MSGGGGGSGGVATTTDTNDQPGEIVSYLSTDFYVGGSASTTAEFNFDKDVARFTISSTTANATGTITSPSGAIILGSTGERTEFNFNVADTLRLFSSTGVNTVDFGGLRASSTFASTSRLSLFGSLFDRTSSAGTNGQVLQSNGSGVTWVSTSTLGISGGTGSSIVYLASSTPWTAGNLAYVVSNGAVSSVATTTLTATAPIALSNPISVLGNTPSVLTCATASGSLAGCLSTGDWTSFNNKVSSSSIDTLAELETLQGGINIIQSTEINTSALLAGLLSDETGSTNGGLSVFSNAPTFTGTSVFNAISVTNTSTLGFASSTALTVSGNAWLNFASSTSITSTRANFTNASTSFASTTALTVTGNTILTNATATNLFATNASSTNFWGAGLSSCSGSSNKITWTGGKFSCETDQTGGGGGSLPDWNQATAGQLSPSTTIGIGVRASSTIGNGTATGGLTINGGATTTGNAYVAGTLNTVGAVRFNNLVSCDTIDTDSSGNLVCGTDGGGGGSSKWTDGTNFTYLTNSTYDLAIGAISTTSAPFWWDVSATTSYIGNGGAGDSVTTFGPVGSEWTMGYDYDANTFGISSSTVLGTNNFLTMFSTTSMLIASSTLGGNVTDGGVRMTIGNYGVGSIQYPPRHQLNLNGRIDTGDWVQSPCNYPNALAGAALSADTAAVCGNWMFQEDTTATLTFSFHNGVPSMIVRVGAGLASDGGGIFLMNNAGAQGLQAGSSTPFFQAVARIDTPANATNTRIIIGLPTETPNSSTFESVKGGCYFFSASSTPNWQFMCGASATAVDTGIASTTSATAGLNQFYKFNVWMDARKGYGQIITRNTVSPVFSIDYSQPALSLTPSAYVTTITAGSGNRGIEVKSLDLWYRIGL